MPHLGREACCRSRAFPTLAIMLFKMANCRLNWSTTLFVVKGKEHFVKQSSTTSNFLTNTLAIWNWVMSCLGYMKFVWSVRLKHSFSIWGWYSRICQNHVIEKVVLVIQANLVHEISLYSPSLSILQVIGRQINYGHASWQMSFLTSSLLILCLSNSNSIFVIGWVEGSRSTFGSPLK